jgi:trehalose 6-phosphate synthase
MSRRRIRSIPAMLVLSRFAGAARQLDAAVLVNPNDIDASGAASHSPLR